MRGGLLLSYLVALLLFGEMPSTAEPNYEALDVLTDGSNKFAVALYQALSRQSSGNVVVSPVSLQLVLALAQCGAVGATADEVSLALGLPEDKDLSLNGHKSLIQLLQLPVLTVANRMFVNSNIELKPEFKDLTSKFFFASAECAEFSTNPEAARMHINKWVEDNTNQKIRDLLASGTVKEDTRLVLVNAVHFKAKWALPFEEHRTVDEPFYITPSESVKVPMMHINKKFKYAANSELDAQLVELPYEGREMRMILIVPRAKDGLENVESKLGGVNLAQLFLSLREANVDLSMPRFKIEQTIDLEGILSNMGMSTMFSNAADFTGITETEPLKVSKVVQKAFIEVNEEGTEAAAATGGRSRSGRSGPCSLPLNVIVIADHPFLYTLVRARPQTWNSTVFIGCVRHAR